MNRLTFAVVLYAVLMSSVASIGHSTFFPAAFPGTNGKIAFTRTSDIWVMNADGSDQTQLTYEKASGSYADSPAWSPDGTKIAFEILETYSIDEIYLMNADGSGQTQLTHEGVNMRPTWSPDGSKIAFVGIRDGMYDIYVMNADGSGQHPIYPVFHYGQLGDPAWSPDGSKIAFSSNRDGKDGIYVMNADGSGVTRLGSKAAYEFHPAWSPDGTKIAFTSFGDIPDTYSIGSFIFIMNADGSGQTRLTWGRYNDDGEPDWQRKVETQSTTAQQTSTSSSFYATSTVQSVPETTILQTPNTVLIPGSSSSSILLGVILGLVVSMPISVYRLRRVR